MQIKNHEDLLTPVFNLIKQYAPNTYEAMQNTYWPVTLVKDESDFDEITGSTCRHCVSNLADTLAGGLGCTYQAGADTLIHTTWLNFNLLNAQAAESGYAADKLAATVAVHEWTHRRGYGEPEAYAAGARFARAMGEEAIAQSQEVTGERVAREAEQEQMDLFDYLRGIGVYA